MILALVALCSLPWLLIAARRGTAVLGILTALTAGALTVVLGSVVGSLSRIDPAVITVVAGIAGAAVGIVVLARGPRLRRPARGTVAVVAAASTGTLLWLGALALARLLPGADSVSWAMYGDAVNTLRFLWDAIGDSGVSPASQSPAALPLALLAAATAVGRPADAPLAHDLDALALVWAGAIALSALLLGLTASALLRRGPVAAIAAGGASLLAATWLVAGLPIEAGFFNVHVALPFALASWLAFGQSRAHPRAAAVLLLCLAVLLLATWAPLVALPAVFTGMIAVRHWSVVRRARGVAALPVLLAVLLLLAWAALFTLPLLATQRAALEAPDLGFPFVGWHLLAAALIVVLGAVLLPEHRAGLLGAVTAFAAALLVLLAIAREQPEPWNAYYPAKLAWLAAIVLLALALAVLVRLAADWLHGSVVLAVVVLAIAVSAIGPVPSTRTAPIEQPLARMLLGHAWNEGDASAAIIAARATEQQPVIYARSGLADEAMITFWMLEFEAGGTRETGTATRVLAYEGYRAFRDTGTSPEIGVDRLCAALEELGTTTVVTADAGLESELAAACPAADPVIELRE